MWAELRRLRELCEPASATRISVFPLLAAQASEAPGSWIPPAPIFSWALGRQGCLGVILRRKRSRLW